MIYKQQIGKQCAPIVSMVLAEMGKLEHRMNIRTGENRPSIHPVLYRWWFPIEFAEYIAARYKQEKNTTENILAHVLTQKFENQQTYCALYFGKSNNGSRRLHEHTQLTVHDSTLRRTICGICCDKPYNGNYDKTNEDIVTEILNRCYCEWMKFPEEDKHLIECIEGICIAMANYPLNLDGNPNISEEWRKYLTEKRKLK